MNKYYLRRYLRIYIYMDTKVNNTYLRTFVPPVMKYSCARLAPKHDVADAEAAEQWPRKEADEATGSLG